MRRLVGFAVVVGSLSSCTTFSNVRSAEIHPGLSTELQVAATTPVGPETGWFWAYDCAQNCGHAIAGGDATFTFGSPENPMGRRRYAVGGGLNGLYPYLEAYVQLGAGTRPYGIGARVGLPSDKWFEHQIYTRHDVPLGSSRRLLLNPALFMHHGRSPNGENPGSFIGFVQGVGLLLEGERVSYVPALSFVVGRAERTSHGQKFGPETAVFGTASLSVTFHRPRSDEK